MKEKTSITLSKEVLAAIDRAAGSKQSRSAFIEAVLAQYLRKRARAQVEARDLELINKAADELNAEVEDILHHQDFGGIAGGWDRDEEMRRGEIYRVHHPGDPAGNDPKLYRSFVVVSRQVLIDSRFPTVICAPILTRGHGFSTQVSIGVDEGLKHESSILCDNLVSLRKVQLTRFVGSLARSKVDELDRALKMALALE
jgi:mRNA interferase MazF